MQHFNTIIYCHDDNLNLTPCNMTTIRLKQPYYNSYMSFLFIYYKCSFRNLPVYDRCLLVCVVYNSSFVYIQVKAYISLVCSICSLCCISIRSKPIYYMKVVYTLCYCYMYIATKGKQCQHKDM